MNRNAISRKGKINKKNKNEKLFSSVSEEQERFLSFKKTVPDYTLSIANKSLDRRKNIQMPLTERERNCSKESNSQKVYEMLKARKVQKINAKLILPSPPYILDSSSENTFNYKFQTNLTYETKGKEKENLTIPMYKKYIKIW